MTSAVSRLEHCITYVASWMFANRLKLNTDKTELLWAGSKFSNVPLGIFVRHFSSESTPSHLLTYLLMCLARTAGGGGTEGFIGFTICPPLCTLESLAVL